MFIKKHKVLCHFTPLCVNKHKNSALLRIILYFDMMVIHQLFCVLPKDTGYFNIMIAAIIFKVMFRHNFESVKT